MNENTRRHFLKSSALAFPALALQREFAKKGSPNGRIRAGMIGAGGRAARLNRTDLRARTRGIVTENSESPEMACWEQAVGEQLAQPEWRSGAEFFTQTSLAATRLTQALCLSLHLSFLALN